MKFNCGLTPEEKRHERWLKRLAEERRLKQWHTMFAYKPIRMTDSHTCVWLEPYERRGTSETYCGYTGWTWEYREFK